MLIRRKIKIQIEISPNFKSLLERRLSRPSSRILSKWNKDTMKISVDGFSIIIVAVQNNARVSWAVRIDFPFRSWKFEWWTAEEKVVQCKAGRIIKIAIIAGWYGSKLVVLALDRLLIGVKVKIKWD